MKLIVLTGLPDTGKTDTFEKIRKKLSVYETPTIIEQLGSDPRDLLCIFPTLKVGLYPMGDYISLTRKAISWGLKNELNVLVYAYSQSFEAFIQAYKSFPNIDIEIQHKTMTVNSDKFNEVNEIDALRILLKINYK